MSLEPAPAAQAMVRALTDGGVTDVYGIPGGYTIKLFEAIRDAAGIDAVLAPSEQIAACMADMHGRLTGRPAVLSGQGAFIAGTGSFGIMEAFLSIAKQGSAELAEVSQPIAEALVTTALALASAVPAVVMYNYFQRRLKVLNAEMANFSNDFMNIVKRHFF